MGSMEGDNNKMSDMKSESETATQDQTPHPDPPGLQVNGANNNWPTKDKDSADKDKSEPANGLKLKQMSPSHHGPNDPNHSDLEPGSKKEKPLKRFWDGVLADLKNKDLLPLKILFFFKYATLFVLYPFLTLHLKSLGLDATEAGINSALIPVFSIFGPPFSGVIADKIGNFKVFLAAITLLNAPLALSLLLVPKAREMVDLPSMVTLSLSCETPNSPFFLRTLDSSICHLNQSSVFDATFPETSVQCGSICPLDSVQKPGHNMSLSPFTSTFPFPPGTYRLPDDTSVFIPHSAKKTDLICDPTRTKCFLATTEESSSEFSTEELLIPFGVSQLKFWNRDNLSGDDLNNLNLTHPLFYMENQLVFGQSTFNATPSCSRVNQEIPVGNGTCRTECLLQYNRSLLCSNTDELKVYNVPLTFGLYTLIRILLGVASATSFIMFEGAVLAILKEFGGDYGLQRVSATLAAIIAAPLSGSLIQIFHHFYPAFYLYAVLQVISAILTLKIDLSFKPPAEKIIGHLKEVLSQIEILIFFCAMLLSGTAWGYIESFLFWFLQDLNGSNVLMGLTISIGGLAGIPLLICSRPLIKQFGHVNILCLGLVFYCVRLIGYSYIENPWMCLPFEAMEAITSSLAITAAATYAAALSSPETIASIQGLWGGIYFGFGRGAGSLMGGFFHKWYGARNTFRIFSFMSLIAGLLYFIVNVLYIEKYSKHQRKGRGIDLTDIRGDKHTREQKEKNRLGSMDSGHAMEPMEKFYDGGYIGPCDVNKFTDVPLDEETPECPAKFPQNLTNRNKKNSNKEIANSSL